MTGDPQYGPSGHSYPAQQGPAPQHPWEQPGGGSMPPGPRYTGSYPSQPARPQQSGPFPPQQSAKTDWTYGLPPGVRPDLLRAPLGQHGSMAGSAWEQRGNQATMFARLVLVELRKLAGTLSDRLLLMLAPVALLVVTWYSATQVLPEGQTSATAQIFGVLLACHLGPVLLYTVVLKTFSGEWHYRSIQLTLLLQPRRIRYGAAQLTAVLLVWLGIALIQYGMYFGIKYYSFTSGQLAGKFQGFLLERPLWLLGVTLLASFLSLLFLFAIAFLVPNPTAAVAIYLVSSGLYLFRLQDLPVLGYLDPWQPASLLAGAVSDPVPAITSAALLITAVVAGFVALSRRDAR